MLTRVTLHGGSATVTDERHDPSAEVTEPVHTLFFDWSYCALP
jgi:hypothetical protein